MVVPAQIMRLLGHAGLRRILANHRAGGPRITFELEGEGDNEVEDIYGGIGTRRARKTKGGRKKFPAVPSEEGQRLMEGGIFGSSEYYRDRRMKRKSRLARRIMSRELGTDRSNSIQRTNALSQV